jgi:hypothetical protein
MSETRPVGAAEFVRIIRGASDEEVRRIVNSSRDQILDGLFAVMESVPIPPGMRGVIEWRIGGGEDGGVDRYATVVADGGCTAERGPATETDLVVSADAVDLLRVASRSAPPARLVAQGRLRVQGDLRIAAQLDRWFRSLDAATGK